MPRQSSLAAGVLQTAMRLCVAIGLGITTAAFGSEQNTPRGHRDIHLSYSRAYLCGIIFACIGLLFVPFMKIEPQGTKPLKREPTTQSAEHRPRNGGEYVDDVESEAGVDSVG